ncbi:ankyrin repeat protein [Histoplasma capsulatum var. duboisii H88]|uniref:Ankyrin repeat protein n=2 Tax=Ajellomyces capsulatus TaxID=5037 RepID=F0UV04_AJEC8|nr:ankyrin repeat protein [Histoplasma capsulatum H143]EGC49731.1 ankyrin repeat protein [Histoplasma capsulatum var. duboisii H88]
MSIWTAAQNGRLTEGVLQDFLERDPDLLNREDGSGITPLGYALLNGKARAVKCLLDNGADPDKPMGETTTFRDGRTPMYLATIANPPSPRIVQLLLEKKPATFDKPISASKNQTPLMAAIAGKSNPEIVKLLINAGASPEAQDDDGKTARDLADALSDFASKQKIKDALEPTLRKGGGRGGLRSYMTNWVARVLGKSRSWRALGPIFKSASRYFLNIAPPASFHPEEELETEKLETAEDFKNSLDNIVNDDGLGRFFPPGNTYVKEVAEKTASLKNDPNNLLNSPSQLKGLATMALYQPIIYCELETKRKHIQDDSGSMRGELWEKQAELVKRITGIATRADPNNRGLYFRLINEDLSFADNLDGDAILRTLGKIVPHGNTQLGTQLRKRILDPIIRRPLYAGTPLERPYLIMIITDGCPTLEPSDQLRNVILDCSQFLGDKGYRKDELVDTRYDELRQNEAELEDWLLSMLLSPVQALNAE